VNLLRLIVCPLLLALGCALPAVRAAEPAAGKKPAREAKRLEQIRASAPIKNFRLPTFTVQGYREFMLRAGEAIIPDAYRIEVKEMELTLFTRTAADEIDAMLAAPSATFFPKVQIVSGDDTMRLERSDLSVSGAGWTYDHKTRKLIITRDARVTFHAPIGDIIK